MYISNGKQVLWQHRDTKAITHIADAADNEKAHFLATMANAPKGEDGGPLVEYDYMGEADKTCSIVWNPQFVHKDDFMRNLNNVVQTAEVINLFKKLLFRGKTPDDLDLSMPGYQRSLAPYLERATEEQTNIIHGIIGVITETGELAELLVAFMEGREFDRVHLLEEGGDVSWYIVRVLRGIKATMRTMHVANIDKLHGRHGEAFDVFRDANRNLAVERDRLEAAAEPLPLLMEDAIMPEITKPVPHSGDMADMVQRMEDIGALAKTHRVRNDPPLPPGVQSAPSVGKRTGPCGDVEGMDC